MKSAIATLLLATFLASNAQANEMQDLTNLRTQIVEEFEDWEVVAVCGVSSGKSYFLQEIQKGWQDDQISTGNLVFVKGSDGKPDVIFLDATQEAKSATLEGAGVYEVFARKETNEYVWIATYPSTGTTETYTLSLDPNSIKLVMWSQGRPSVQLNNDPRAQVGAKIASFVARCA